MPRKRRPRKPKPTRRPVTPAELRDLAEAQLLSSRALVQAARARAIDAATARGDRTAGFVGPLADAGGGVAAQTEEDS
jgi:hypothetical protein